MQGRTIDGKMTASNSDHPVAPDDPQASLRAELLSQISAAQFALESALAEFSEMGRALGQTQSQLATLAALRQQIGIASPVMLSNMSAEIGAAVAEVQNTIQLARDSASNGEGSSASIAAKARQAMESLGEDLFRRNLLDPYLRFESADDEAGYRRREEENRAAYEHELAKNTPEGNRRAAEILSSQVEDARRHGAEASPDFDDISRRAEQALSATAEPARESVRSDQNQDAATQSANTDSELADVMAALRVAGVTTIEPANGPSAHGLSDQARITSVEQNASSGRFA
jgi:hypothetical protein